MIAALRRFAGLLAALLFLPPPYTARAAGEPEFRLLETTIAEVQSAMKDGKLTARQLVDLYLSRIDAYDKMGPALNAVILVNPKAREIADELDAKFKATCVDGPCGASGKWCRPVGVQSCVRPVDAALITAGSDEVRD